jgi:hypothetical protein
VLVRSERIFEADHPLIRICRISLAHVYLSVGRFDDAIPLFEQALADRERILGADHPDTLTSASYLAAAYALHHSNDCS